MNRKYLERAAKELRNRETMETAALNLEDELRELEMRLRLGGPRPCLEQKRDRTAKRLDTLRARMCRCERALDTLTVRERYLIEHLYAYRTPKLDIMETLHVEKTAYYRLRRSAVSSFVRALYGVELYGRQP